ncbi:MAG: NAD(P)H-dependent oxidoreductase subunit E, partial [Hyphomicrobiales bacterium]|nr:NAD(P)H-dependent oxidoreductase subunit E [Hyphomicrobiales bacterium]
MDAEKEDFKTGRKRRERGPKGRPLDENALGEIRALLGDRPRRRDLLIEFLHLIQDRWGCLSAARLLALAEEMRLSQVEVYEVASFYDHFDVVKEGETPPPPLTIRICGSISCALAGAEALIHSLRAAVDPKAVRVLHAPCMGRCAGAPAARVGDREVDRATSEEVLALAGAGETKVRVPPYTALEAYRGAGGYRLLARVRSGALR